MISTGHVLLLLSAAFLCQAGPEATWEDCGSTKAISVALNPNPPEIGQAWKISTTFPLAQYVVDGKASLDVYINNTKFSQWSGEVCGSQSWLLPNTMGNMTLNGIACPARESAASSEVIATITASSFVGSAMIQLEEYDSDNKQLTCLQIRWEILPDSTSTQSIHKQLGRNQNNDDQYSDQN